jgi:flagellin-specific chaperone FliS
MKTTVKIWFGVGAAILVTPAAMGSSEHASHAAALDRREVMPSHRLLFLAQARGPGGESGEAGGEKGSAATLAPEVFALKIAQMRGQLLVADELVEQRQWSAALPHIQHAQDALYPQLRRQLKQYDAASFDRELRVLTRLAKAKKGRDEYAKAYAAIQNALNSAENSLAAKDSDWPASVMETAVDLALSAADEYKQAVANGGIKNLTAYHDARGFILQADRMIKAVAPALEKKDAEALARVRALLTELARALPLTLPAQEGVRDISWIFGNVSRVELAAGRLMQ